MTCSEIRKKENKSMARSFKLIFNVIFFVIFLLSQKSYSLSYLALNYLMISPGATSNGVAGAFTAIANDASGLHFNPAGLSRLKWLAAEYNHGIPEFSDYGSFHFGGVAMAMPEIGVFGIGFKYISLGEQKRTDAQGNLIKIYKSFYWNLSVSYGTTVTTNLSLGLSLNYIYSHLSPLGTGVEVGAGEASVFSFNIGLIYDGVLSQLCFAESQRLNRTGSSPFNTPRSKILPGISFGLAILNMGDKIIYGDVKQGEPFPQNLKLGLAWNFFDSKGFNGIVAFDAEKLLITPHSRKPADPFYQAIFTSWADQSFQDELNEMTLRLGIEISYQNLISLRLGRYIYQEGNPRYWSDGFSVGYKNFQLSYSVDNTDRPGFSFQPKQFIGVSFAY